MNGCFGHSQLFPAATYLWYETKDEANKQQGVNSSILILQEVVRYNSRVLWSYLILEYR